MNCPTRLLARPAALGGLVLSLLVAVPTAVAPAATAAVQTASTKGTLVYVKAHNVWISRADGTGSRAVTRDGTSSNPYRSPSQSDTGIIAVGHGQNIVRMRQDGVVLNRMNPPALMGSAGHPLDGPPQDVAISPDGKLIAYTLASYQCPVGTSCDARTATAITAADRLTPAAQHGTTYLSAASWIGNNRTLQSGGYLHQINLVDLRSAARHWFDDHQMARESTDLGDAELSPNGRWLAAVRGYGSTTHIAWYAVNGNAISGPPPGLPSWECHTEEMAGLADPTWSPDSTTMAWQEPDGIWIKSNPVPCSSPQPRLHIAGGSQPDWSAAPLSAPAKAAPKKFSVTKSATISGKAKVGQRLRVKIGTWSPRPTRVRYRWLRNGKPISRATSSTYRLRKTDRNKRISVRITGSRSSHITRTITSKKTKKVSR